MARRDPRHRIAGRWGVVLGASAVLLVGCGASGSGDRADRSSTTSAATASTSTTEPSVDHRDDLAVGETPGIAGQLVEVPGFRYADVDQREVDAMLAILGEDTGPDVVRAASFHSVIADDEDLNVSRTRSGVYELGFLWFVEFTEPPPLDLWDELARQPASGLDVVDELSFSGTDVVVLEDPDVPESRYTLSWVRHGVHGVIDGAELEPLRIWADAYFAVPERQPDEDDLLTAALVDVPGFAYVNYWEDALIADLEDMFLDDPASIHAVVDGAGTVGVLALVDAPGPFDDASVVEEVEALGADPTGSEEVEGVTTATGVIDAEWQVRVWWHDGVLAAFVSPMASDDLRFVAPYLAG